MTREEAIQFLDNMKHEEAGRAIGKDGFYAELMGYHVQALNIAIKALDQEPKTGFIPKSVIEDIKAELISDYNNNADNWNYCAGIHRAIELIDNRISGKETWNGYHAQITAPKGTFERIFNEEDDNNDI